MTPDDAAAVRRSWLATAFAAALVGALMIVWASGPIASYLDTAGTIVLAEALVLGAVGIWRLERVVRLAMLAVSVLSAAAAAVVAVGFLLAR